MTKHLLLIDTSTPFSYVACFSTSDSSSYSSWQKQTEVLISLSEKKVVGEHENDLFLEGDRWLSELIQYLMKKNNHEKFDYIALGEGPGFFTPLRVGHVTCATLALLWKAKLIHFSSLSFWHDFFLLEKKTLLAIQVNQNLFYITKGTTNNSSKTFLAHPKQAINIKPFLSLNTQELLNLSNESGIKEIFLWQDPWENHASQKSKSNIRRHSTSPTRIASKKNLWKNQENHKIIKTPPLETALLKYKDKIPHCIKYDIEKAIVNIQDFLPVYGHSVLSPKKK